MRKLILFLLLPLVAWNDNQPFKVQEVPEQANKVKEV